jgi:hypothetical protein
MHGKPHFSNEPRMFAGLTHHPDDLVDRYVRLFWRKDLFGPKCPFGEFVEFEFFVLRARHLLATSLDEHLADLFKFPDLNPATGEHAVFARGAVITASWLAGLQKNHRFIDQVINLVNDQKCGGYDFQGVHYTSASAWYAAIVLFDDPSLCDYLLEACRRKNPPASSPQRDIDNARYGRALAHVALEILDLRFGTNHAASVSGENSPSVVQRVRRRLNRVLATSELLRCGAAFSNPEELRAAVAEFIRQSTPLQYHAAGVSAPPAVREQGTAHDGPRTIRTNGDILDIAAMLEQDLLCRQSAENVDALYGRLQASIGFDAELYRQHAYDLLIRSARYDDNARTLLRKAEEIESRQRKLERFPAIKMPAGWASAYPDCGFH